MSDNFKNQVIFFTIFLLLLANIYIWQFVFSLDNTLKITFFDIGQGDSIFIETAQGHQILIDAGPGNRLINKIDKVMPVWDRTVDLIVATHPDYDHLSGFVGFLDRYQADNVIWNGQETTSKTFIDWRAAVAKQVSEQNSREFIGEKGLVIKAGRAKFLVLWPRESQANQPSGESNDGSIVLLLNYGANKFLFTGDITAKSEKQLLSQEPPAIKADVLKIAHHGSKYSSSAEFLAAVAPQIAVISCGENNNYGHPNSEVLNNLQEFAINIRRTDQEGDIKIVSDGKNLIQ